MVVAGGHKWLNAPFGCGLLYVRRSTLPVLRMPSWGYLGLDASGGWLGPLLRDAGQHARADYEFPATAKSLEINGTANYPGAVGLGASLELVNGLGITTIDAHVRELTDRLHDELTRLGVRSSPGRSARRGRGSRPSRCRTSRPRTRRSSQALLDERVYVSMRYTSRVGGIRVSTHLYNDHDDVDRLLQAMRRLLGRPATRQQAPLAAERRARAVPSAARGLRPLARARAPPRHGARLRPRTGRSPRRGTRPRVPLPLELVRELAELGLMGIPFPEELGGAGGDTLAYAIAVEELTRIDSSVAITLAAHTSLGTMPIYLFGTDAQRAEWLPQLASGERLAAFGLTEADAGSDAGATRTTAELHDGQWVLNGSKMFITNAGTDITACVTITAAPARTRSRTSSSRTGRPATRSRRRCTSWLEGLRHARPLVHGLLGTEANLLGERGQGFRQFLEILDGGRITVAAMGVGLAQGAYDLASATRGAPPVRQADRVVPAIQFARRHGDRDRSRPRARLEGGLAEGQGRRRPRGGDGEALGRAVEPGRQRGAADPRRLRLMDESPIARLYRDQKVLEIGEGTNEMRRMVIARHLGL